MEFSLPPLEMSKEAFAMTGSSAGIQLVSALPIRQEEGKDSETLISNHAELFSIQHHSFQDAFEINWKRSS